MKKSLFCTNITNIFISDLILLVLSAFLGPWDLTSCYPNPLPYSHLYLQSQYIHMKYATKTETLSPICKARGRGPCTVAEGQANANRGVFLIWLLCLCCNTTDADTQWNAKDMAVLLKCVFILNVDSKTSEKVIECLSIIGSAPLKRVYFVFILLT